MNALAYVDIDQVIHYVKMEKAILGFRIYKIWQILKCFAGTFRRAQTLKLGGVSFDTQLCMTKA